MLLGIRMRRLNTVLMVDDHVKDVSNEMNERTNAEKTDKIKLGNDINMKLFSCLINSILFLSKYDIY